MIYVIQTVVYTALLWLFYNLLLKNKPLHRFNRGYLLSAVTIPFLLPLIKLNLWKDSAITHYTNIRMPEIIISDKTIAEKTDLVFYGFMIGYAFTVICFIAVYLYKWARLKNIIKKAEKIVHREYTLLINTKQGPGSWGRYIFLPETHADERIIAHEAAHIKLKHTRDLMIVGLLQCLFWYNPFLHLIKKELTQVHEFEADAAVKTEKTSYQELLLKHFLQQCQLPFTHSFINHPIKRRIMMLNKNNQSKNNLWRIFFTSAVVLFFSGNMIWLQSCKPKNWEVKNEKKTSKDSIYQYVTQMPEPTFDVSEFLSENLIYPEEAKQKGIEGRVMIRFIINKKGKIENVEVLNSVNELLKQEALRVFKLMPDWRPGQNDQGENVNVYYTQPVIFKIDKEEEATHALQNNKSSKMNMPEIIRTNWPKALSKFHQNEAESILDNQDLSKENEEQPIIKESEIRESVPSEYEATKRTYNAILHPFGPTNEGC